MTKLPPDVRDKINRFEAFILANFSIQIQLDIAYAPAFDPLAIPITLTNLVYERASVIFNLAALYSQLAEGENRSTSDGIKRAAANYQVIACPCLLCLLFVIYQ